MFRPAPGKVKSLGIGEMAGKLDVGGKRMRDFERP
jgi:hypothetical protein